MSKLQMATKIDRLLEEQRVLRGVIEEWERLMAQGGDQASRVGLRNLKARRDQLQQAIEAERQQLPARAD